MIKLRLIVFIFITICQLSACNRPCFISRGVICKRNSGEQCPPCVNAASPGRRKFECEVPVNGRCSDGWIDCRGPELSPATDLPTSVPNPMPTLAPLPSVTPISTTSSPIASSSPFPTSTSGNFETPSSNPSEPEETTSPDLEPVTPDENVDISPNSQDLKPVPSSTIQTPDPSPSVETVGNLDTEKTIPPALTNSNRKIGDSSGLPTGSNIVSGDSTSSNNSGISVWIIVVILGFIIFLLIGGVVWYYLIILQRNYKATDNEISNRDIYITPNNYNPGPDLESEFVYPAPISVTSTTATENTFSSALHSHSNSTNLKPLASKSSDTYAAHCKMLLPYRIDMNEIEDIKPIGSGGFAVVWLVQYRGSKLASKRLHIGKNNTQSKDQLNQFSKEIAIVSSLRHENIVTFVGVAWESDAVVQVLFEYLEGGDLRECLLQQGNDTILTRGWDHKKFIIAKDIACALNYLHSFRPPLLHRDVKARNILLNGDCTSAKLSDFGVSRNISLHSHSQSTMTGGVGTTRWLAPEVLTGSKTYNESCDIYSFGMTLLEMDTHDIPYIHLVGNDGKPLPEATIVFRMATADLKPLEFFSQECDSRILELAARCLQRQPCDRPSAIEVAVDLQKLTNSACTVD